MVKHRVRGALSWKFYRNRILMLRTVYINSKADMGIAWIDPPDNHIYIPIYLQVSTNIGFELGSEG